MEFAAFTDLIIPWLGCTHSPRRRQASLWLSKEQPGGGTIPLCMCSHQSRFKKKNQKPK